MNGKPAEHGGHVLADAAQLVHELALGIRLSEPGRDQAEDPDRGQLHQQQDEIHQGVVHVVDHPDERPRLRAVHREDGREDDGKDDQRKQLHLDRALQEIVREEQHGEAAKQVPHCLGSIGILGFRGAFLHGLGHLLGLGHPGARVDHVDDNDTHDHRQQGRDDVVADGRCSRLPELAHVPQPDDSRHHRGDHQRDHDHLQEAEEDLSTQLQLGPEVGRH